MSKLARLLRVRLKKVKLKKLRSIKWIAGIIFVEFGWYITDLAPSTEIAWVTGLLLFTIYLFIFEIVTVDETAITIMVLLGLSSLLAPTMGLEQGLVDTQHLFDGFASNAVMSIIAVMMIGAGLDKTGMMSKVAGFILKVGGTAEGRIIPIISGTAGIISSFMQNVGAAALLPSGQFVTQSEITASLLANVEYDQVVIAPSWVNALEMLAPLLLAIVAVLFLPDRSRKDIAVLAGFPA